MRPWLDVSEHLVPKSPRQKWIETKESWERSRHIEIPPSVPAAPAATRWSADRLPHLPGQSALWRPGGLHPPSDPGAGRRWAIRSRCSPGRPGPSSTRGWASPRCPASTSTGTPTRSACPTAGSSPAGRTGRSSPSCAPPGSASPWPSPPGLASSWPIARATSTWSTTTSASGPGMLGHGRRRLAAADDAAPPDHRRPRAGALAHHQPWQRFTTRRWFGFLRHAGQGGPGAARGRHGLAVLPQGHRRADAGASRADDRRARSASTTRCSARRDDVTPMPGRIMVTSSSDVPMKGLVPLLEAVAKTAHRTRGRADRHRASARGRPGRPGHRADWASPTSCAA